MAYEGLSQHQFSPITNIGDDIICRFKGKRVYFVRNNSDIMIKWMIAATAALLMTACGWFGGKSDKTKEKMTEKEMVAGGYTQQRALKEDETALFEAATRGLTGVSYTPESVATQIVAGTNYRFICTAVTATADPKTYKAMVTIFRPLPGRGDPKITSIERL